jgi:hypothetical protein
MSRNDKIDSNTRVSFAKCAWVPVVVLSCLVLNGLTT